ncbi:MAG: DUF5320 domain-containing protein [Patescibacteria group bacterium]
MPRLDGTGPQGSGPGTGWGRGPCVYGMRQRAFACGFGGRRFISPKNEKAALEEEEKMLEEELAAVREEKKALEKSQN